MIEKGLVSVLTPCFNGEKFIDRLLDSILLQDYRKIEFIFVDDGSIDSTGDIITNYNFNQAENEYVLYPEFGLVTKQVGSTYQPVLGFKNAFLKIRCTLDNVTISVFALHVTLPRPVS